MPDWIWDWEREIGYLVFVVVGNLVAWAYKYIRDNHRQNLGSVMVHIGSSSTPPKSGWNLVFDFASPGVLAALTYCAVAETWQNEGHTSPVHTLIACAIIAALFSLYKQNERLHGQKEPAA